MCSAIDLKISITIFVVVCVSHENKHTIYFYDQQSLRSELSVHTVSQHSLLVLSCEMALL